MNVTNIPNNTVYFRIIMMEKAHPVLLSSGGILVGYLLQPNYYRQMFYSSQVIASRTCYGGKWSDWTPINSNLPGIEFLTRTITVESGKQAYDLQINATEYMVISICSEDRMGWQYTVTRGVSGTEATQNWAVCFIGNPTGTFTFKVAVLKIK